MAGRIVGMGEEDCGSGVARATDKLAMRAEGPRSTTAMRIEEQEPRRSVDVLQRPKELISDVLSVLKQGENVNYVSGSEQRA
eukprot:768082-Hanusia_phi.AAC.6